MINPKPILCLLQELFLFFLFLLDARTYTYFYLSNLKLNYHDGFYCLIQVWNRIAPGLDSQFDSIYSVPAIAPRPLLLLNGNIHILPILS